MRTVFIVVVLLIVYLLVANSYSQSMSPAQYVGGNFGQSWIGGTVAQNPKPAVAVQDPGNDLWTWGGAPKGSIIVNGKLAPDPYYIWKSLNYTSGWLGMAYVDPSTGYPIYAYTDPYTGMVIYFYVDPKTGNPVYTNVYPNVYPATGFPYYGSVTPYYLSNYWPGSNVLPPVFNSNNPWD
jgi:hypothetical protein